ncbi:hypothetical protein [Kitasatospora sp. NPDC017646]|uniref:LmrA/YxaF family transcription factor n=1 Tax=Kitasatospora sp. NPDC017646 TaxID=3364024 RepID=UPI0037A04CB0
MPASAVVSRSTSPEWFPAAMAGTVISALEGAELAAQVARSEEPLHVAGRHLARLLATYLPHG